jgi:SulP family sulfate permease
VNSLISIWLKWLKFLFDPAILQQISLFPLLNFIRGYTADMLRRDSRAALSVALIGFPQGMVFSLIIGLPLHYGIYAVIISSIIGGIFVSSKSLIIGPTNAISILILSILHNLQMTGIEKMTALPVLLMMTGLILLIGAWFRIASLTQYISRSVISGYLIAAVALITANQLGNLLGIDTTETGVFLHSISETLGSITDINWTTVGIAIVTLLGYLILNRISPRIPTSFVLLLTLSLAIWSLSFFTDFSVQYVNVENAFFLSDNSTTFSLNSFGQLPRAAVAIAFLSFLEASITGRALAARAGEHFNANQQMFALGITNIGQSFFSGLPASVSRIRSTVNVSERAATPISGILSGIFCTILFFSLSPFFSFIPIAVLATVTVIVAIIRINRHYLRVIFHTSKSDPIVLIGTIICGLLFPLDAAIYMGAGISIIFFLKKVGTPELIEYDFNPEGELAELKKKGRTTPDISIVHVEGDLFFGSAEIFLDQARRVCDDPNLKVIVLRMKNAHHLDATCAMAIEDLLRFAREHDRHIIVSSAHREIFRVFRNSGLLETLGRKNFFMDTPSNPTLSTRNALKRAQELLGQQKANIRIYVDPAKQDQTITAEPVDPQR